MASAMALEIGFLRPKERASVLPKKGPGDVVFRYWTCARMGVRF